MNKNCTTCGSPFPHRPEDLEFYSSIAVQIGNTTEDIPPPSLCPDCRQQKRMAFCNEGLLYHNKSALSGKPLISQLPAENPRPVYTVEEWWGDTFDPLEYGRELDLDRSILDQIHELELVTPHCCVNTDLDNENAEYTHHAGHEKNCYLMFHTSYAEDCYYGYGVKKCESCVDNYYCHESQLCYECIDVKKCYDLKWSQDCQNCSASLLLRDCIGCKSCILCTGLRNKEYCILNEQLSKEEYERRSAQLNTGSYAQLQTLLKTFEGLQEKHTYKCVQNEMCENCRGNQLFRARDCFECYDCSDAEEAAYCTQLQMGTKTCHDIYQFGINIERCYDCAMIGYNIYNCHFCYDLLDSCSNLLYCMNCFASKDSFGCVGLKHKRYCILNRQYTQGEYEELIPKIIERMRKTPVSGSGTGPGPENISDPSPDPSPISEWAFFFPLHMSPSAYNETSAQLWYPLSREEVSAKGLQWYEDSEEQKYMGPPTTLPDDIAAVEDSLCEQILVCEDSDKPYKIIPQELAYYREHRIPIPRLSYRERHKARFRKRNPRELFARPCGKCGEEMETVYHPERPEKVLCEACYRETVY